MKMDLSTQNATINEDEGIRSVCQTATVQIELHNWTSINRDSRVSGTSDLSRERSSCMLFLHCSCCSWSNTHVSYFWGVSVHYLFCLFQDCFEDAFDRIPVWVSHQVIPHSQDHRSDLCIRIKFVCVCVFRASKMDLRTSIEECSMALNLVLNNKFSEALDLLKPWYTTDSLWRFQSKKTHEPQAESLSLVNCVTVCL